MLVVLTLLADAVISDNFPGDGMRLGCRRWEVNYELLESKNLEMSKCAIPSSRDCPLWHQFQDNPKPEGIEVLMPNPELWSQLVADLP